MTSGVPSLRPAHRCDGQRPVVLPWFVGTRTEERVDALVEDVVESVDVDFSVDIVERHLWRNTALFWKHKQEMAGGKKRKTCWCVSVIAPVRSQSPRISRSYSVWGLFGRLWRAQCEKRTCSWKREDKKRRNKKKDLALSLLLLLVSPLKQKRGARDHGSCRHLSVPFQLIKSATHLSLRLRNQYPLLGVTSIFPFLLIECRATPRSQSVFLPTSTCPQEAGNSLTTNHRDTCGNQMCQWPDVPGTQTTQTLRVRWSHLPVVSPRGDGLPAQYTDDSVKPLWIVWKQLVSISTPHLQKNTF